MLDCPPPACNAVALRASPEELLFFSKLSEKQFLEILIFLLMNPEKIEHLAELIFRSE